MSDTYSPVVPSDARSDADAVVLRGVDKAFNGSPALRGLDVEAPAGRITVLLGPNGAGKTTAIRIITGAMPADHVAVQPLVLDTPLGRLV